MIEVFLMEDYQIAEAERTELMDQEFDRNYIELSVKMFRLIYQTALWCCRTCEGTERQG